MARNIGITPACAGKTQNATLRSPCVRDHPRVCGKNTVLRNIVPIISGSPPRVREKHSYMTSSNEGLGITPACAGKTNATPEQHRLVKDHPRVCGKNFSILCCWFWIAGSPPRVREKLLNLVLLVLDSRITPACAGKTLGLST